MKKNTYLSKSKKHILPLLLSGTMLFTMTGCGNNSDRNTNNNRDSKISSDNTTKPNEDFKTTYSNFSVDLLKANGKNAIKEGANILISPQSTTIAMTMAATGAENNTKKEIYDTLAKTIVPSDYNKMLSYMQQSLCENGDYISSANSIWIRKVMENKINEDFLNTNKSFFNADSFYAAFDDSTVKEINNWVDKNTNHMIPTIISDINPDTQMYLINAIAFNGKWKTKYSKDQVVEDFFTNSNGDTENCKMLASTEHIFISDQNATGLIKSYDGNKYAFMAILPNEGTSVSDYLDSFTGEALQELYSSQTNTDVIAQIPKFSYDYETTLNSSLKELGIKDAFTQKADFSNMLNPKADELYIDSVIHKTHITLNEVGTEAAAVTAVEMRTKNAAVPSKDTKTVILNRPFIYAIMDTDTGLPIFIGVVNSVE